MKQLEQIKTIRDEAMERLQSNYDYKILVSLSNLIADLEEVEGEVEPEVGTITKLDVYTNTAEEIADEESNQVAEAQDEQDDTDSRSELVNRAFERMSSEVRSENYRPNGEYTDRNREDDPANDSIIN